MNDSGQAMAEYAIIVFFMVVSLTGMCQFFLQGLGTHYRIVSALVSLPIP